MIKRVLYVLFIPIIALLFVICFTLTSILELLLLPIFIIIYIFCGKFYSGYIIERVFDIFDINN